MQPARLLFQLELQPSKHQGEVQGDLQRLPIAIAIATAIAIAATKDADAVAVAIKPATKGAIAVAIGVCRWLNLRPDDQLRATSVLRGCPEIPWR